MVPTKFGISFTTKFLNQAGALFQIYTDGTILVTHGGVEMGQGLHTKVAQIAASFFDIPLISVFISETSTDKPYYAEELTFDDAKGVELDNILKRDPLTEKYTNVKYDATTVIMDAKPLLKEALLAEVGFPVDSEVPVIGFIGRLEEQKGSDILATTIYGFIDEQVHIIALFG
ncbi:hypothetical protein AgCh_009140 [Apium graveolens]